MSGTDERRVDLTGQVAWVTGGAGGFGAGVSRRLAEHGARVVVTDIDAEVGEVVAKEIDGRFLRVDVRSPEDNKAAVQLALQEFGRLDIAFLNAGVASGIGVGEDFDLERYRLAMGVNLDGVVFGMHEALAAMAGRGGDIIATASLAGIVAVPFDPIYGANKHAVVGLVRATGAAYAAQGIRINAICPGFADTNIVSSEAREAIAGLGIPLLPVSKVVDAFMAALASGRSGECWYVQPGRDSEPFRFRGVPGPRDDEGTPPPEHAGEIGAALAERGAH
jgi:NAD(P)-dependent dehydrogenase (short-subunit alcohol dehydrogenase family)